MYVVHVFIASGKFAVRVQINADVFVNVRTYTALMTHLEKPLQCLVETCNKAIIFIWSNCFFMITSYVYQREQCLIDIVMTSTQICYCHTVYAATTVLSTISWNLAVVNWYFRFTNHPNIYVNIHAWACYCIYCRLFIL